MKKLALIFSIILIAFYLVLSVVDTKGTYTAEKSLWKINTQLAKLTRDPDAVPSASFDTILKKYDRFIEKNPGSPLSTLAKIQKGQVYTIRKDNEQARKIFESILAEEPKSEPVTVLVFNQILTTYMKENNYAKMRATYDRILKNAPYTELGMRAPLLKALTYVMEKKTEQQQKALTEALTYYRSLSEQFPNTELDFFSRYFTIETLSALKRWQETLNVLESILLDFPDPRFLTEQHIKWILTRINNISINGLKDFDRPGVIYNKFITKYPNHPLNKLLTKVIGEIKTLEKKVAESNKK